MTVNMLRSSKVFRLFMLMAALSLAFAGAPAEAVHAATHDAEQSSSANAAGMSGCGHSAATPEPDTGDENDCGEASGASCTICKCTGNTGFAVASAPAANDFFILHTNGAARPIKPALDPPRA